MINYRKINTILVLLVILCAFVTLFITTKTAAATKKVLVGQFKSYQNLGTTDESVEVVAHTPALNKISGVIDIRGLGQTSYEICKNIIVDDINGKILYQNTNFTWGSSANTLTADKFVIKTGEVVSISLSQSSGCITKFTKNIPPSGVPSDLKDYKTMYVNSGKPTLVYQGDDSVTPFLYINENGEFELPICGSGIKKDSTLIQDINGRSVNPYDLSGIYKTYPATGQKFTAYLSSDNCVALIKLNYYLFSDSPSGKYPAKSSPLVNQNGYQYISPLYIVRVYANSKHLILGDVNSIVVEAYERANDKDMTGIPLNNVDVYVDYRCTCGGLMGGGTNIYGKGVIQNGKAVLRGSFSEDVQDVGAVLSGAQFESNIPTEKTGILTVSGQLSSRGVGLINLALKIILVCLTIGLFVFLIKLYRKRQNKPAVEQSQNLPNGDNTIDVSS